MDISTVAILFSVILTIVAIFFGENLRMAKKKMKNIVYFLDAISKALDDNKLSAIEIKDIINKAKQVLK